MNRERICTVRGVFANIYEWGEGWSQETAKKWHDYLENYKGIYWDYFRDSKELYGSDYLVSTGGAIFLHPMDFHAVLRSSGGRSRRGHDDELEDYFGGELDELKELCEGLAQACGGQFISMVAETQVIENNNLKQWEGRK